MKHAGTTHGTKGKIPCSVSMLTYNSADGLAACLESLKDFAEIIVCDANSTDETRSIARAAGAHVIKQYDTDEPLVPCAMDKAAVRERAMSASTLPWRFFMDSDDTLSHEAAEEIRAIVTDAHPPHWVWRMPTRVFIDGREIKHEATYPSYQTRLVHECVGAQFVGSVHDRLDFDAKRFPVGTMRSFYNFGWPAERVAHYWKYLSTYADREIQTSDFQSWRRIFYKAIYRRLRTIAGYIFWRLPLMYLRYGMRDSMPLSIELTIVRYHCRLLIGIPLRYLRTRSWFILLRETLRGKDLNRILTNIAVMRDDAYGRVLDLGGGDGSSSYWRYLKTARWNRRTVADIHPGADVKINLEEGPIPFPDGHFDTVLFFNVLEHLHARQQALVEIHRVLHRNGALVGIVPFLVRYHPDPHDYARYTQEELRTALSDAGFKKVTIEPVGRGPLTASYYQSEFLWPRVFKLVLIPVVLGLDTVILKLRPSWRAFFPLSYRFVAVK